MDNSYLIELGVQDALTKILNNSFAIEKGFRGWCEITLIEMTSQGKDDIIP